MEPLFHGVRDAQLLQLIERDRALTKGFLSDSPFISAEMAGVDAIMFELVDPQYVPARQSPYRFATQYKIDAPIPLSALRRLSDEEVHRFQKEARHSEIMAKAHSAQRNKHLQRTVALHRVRLDRIIGKNLL